MTRCTVPILLLAASCGGSPAADTPEDLLAEVLEQFHPAAKTFAKQYSKEFENDDLDSQVISNSKAFPALLKASHRMVPDFALQDDDLSSLGSFALYLGFVDRNLEQWPVRMIQDPSSPDRMIAIIQLPSDLGSPAFLVRVAPNNQKGWQLASWPPLQRWAFQDYGPASARLRLSVEAGLAQVCKWDGTSLHSPLSADPQSILRDHVKDLLLLAGNPDAEGLPTAPIHLLAVPEAPASLLLEVLQVLGEYPIRWSRVKLGTSSIALDLYWDLEQQLAWEPTDQDLILQAGEGASEWEADLAGWAPGAPVGLRVDPALPVSAVIADLDNLKARGFPRAFIALPAAGR